MAYRKRAITCWEQSIGGAFVHDMNTFLITSVGGNSLRIDQSGATSTTSTLCTTTNMIPGWTRHVWQGNWSIHCIGTEKGTPSKLKRMALDGRVASISRILVCSVYNNGVHVSNRACRYDFHQLQWQEDGSHMGAGPRHRAAVLKVPPFALAVAVNTEPLNNSWK